MRRAEWAFGIGLVVASWPLVGPTPPNYQSFLFIAFAYLDQSLSPTSPSILLVFNFLKPNQRTNSAPFSFSIVLLYDTWFQHVSSFVDSFKYCFWIYKIKIKIKFYYYSLSSTLKTKIIIARPILMKFNT